MPNHRHFFEKPFRPYKGSTATPVVETMGNWDVVGQGSVDHDHPGGDVPHWHATTVSEPAYPLSPENPGRPE